MSKPRTKEEIFAGMHRELRGWNQQVPESPDRMDPLLKILMQLYAHQLERIDKRLQMVWQTASNSLVRSMCPESMRWPVPAYTVMRCMPVDPVVEVDQHTRFFYKEEREGGQTFFFSPLRKERLIRATTRYMYLAVDKNLVDLSPKNMEDLSATSRPRTAFASGNNYRLYIGIDHTGSPSDFKEAAVFLNGIPDVLRQFHWGYWYPGGVQGNFYLDSGFCPGLDSDLEEMFSQEDEPMQWGGLRSSRDLFQPLENNFVMLPKTFTGTWEPGRIAGELAELMANHGMEVPSDNLYWIRIDLPEGGDKARLNSSFDLSFNSFIAVNMNELTLFKHTGGNKLVEVEIPENIANVLDIVSVVDSAGREYVARHQVASKTSERFYSPEERGDRLVLWFDFSPYIDLPPDSVTINYSVTAGTDANGIEAGKISELYENHPGIDSTVNIVPANGAIPAKTLEQIMTEVSARLRNRDRSISFDEIAKWARTFDPRIVSAACSNGVQRFERGVRRCVMVKIKVKKEEFYSENEMTLLVRRLRSFLKARSAVNTQYQVEIVD